MATQTKVLGVTSPVPMGNWNATTTYNVLNLVRHNTATFISIQSNNTGVEPSVTEGWQNFWQLLAQDGAPGSVPIVQSTGNATDKVMSQDATTQAITTAIAEAITTTLNTEVSV